MIYGYINNTYDGWEDTLLKKRKRDYSRKRNCRHSDHSTKWILGIGRTRKNKCYWRDIFPAVSEQCGLWHMDTVGNEWANKDYEHSNSVE